MAREVAAENLRMVKVRFQIEAVLVKDVLQAQAALEQANAEQAQALVAFCDCQLGSYGKTERFTSL